jgi:group I intron endonuclease
MWSKMFHIYIIQNKLNHKIYVGKTSEPKRRWREHKKVASGGKEKYDRNFRAVHSALGKYGEDNFEFLLVEEFSDELEAYEAEEFWIEFFQSHRKEIGYNETKGGDGFLSGTKHPMYGTHPTQKTRQKLSAARKGKKPTLGVRFSPETRAALSAQRKGSGNAMYGKHHSDDGKKNISDAKIASPKNKGGTHHLATITNEQATEMRSLFANGKTKAEIAKLFGTRWLVVHRIITNQTYKNIT